DIGAVGRVGRQTVGVSPVPAALVAPAGRAATPPQQAGPLPAGPGGRPRPSVQQPPEPGQRRPFGPRGTTVGNRRPRPVGRPAPFRAGGLFRPQVPVDGDLLGERVLLDAPGIAGRLRGAGGVFADRLVELVSHWGSSAGTNMSPYSCSSPSEGHITENSGCN